MTAAAEEVRLALRQLASQRRRTQEDMAEIGRDEDAQIQAGLASVREAQDSVAAALDGRTRLTNWVEAVRNELGEPEPAIEAGIEAEVADVSQELAALEARWLALRPLLAADAAFRAEDKATVLSRATPWVWGGVAALTVGCVFLIPWIMTG